MEKKEYLKIFNNQSDYDSQKDLIMDTPHVVLLDDTQKVIYAPKIDYSKEYFTIEALENGTITIPIFSGASYVAYSKNDEQWVEKVKPTEPSEPLLVNDIYADIQISVKANDKVKLKSDALALTYYEQIEISMPFNLEGNIFSLLKGDDFINPGLTKYYDGAFFQFFMGSKVVSAKNLILPSMKGPSFYEGLFSGCKSLTSAPQLLATTLQNRCYYNMFSNCTSLTTAPQLPATTLAERCYQGMFYGCSNLNYIKMLATDISASDCLDGWVNGVASIGTFVKNAAMTSLPSGINGIPSGWTVENA